MYQEHQKILESYKTIKCTDKNCKHGSIPPSSRSKPQENSTHNCFYYHNNVDRRRVPIKNNKLVYKPFATVQSLQFPGLFNDNEPNCNNGYEYLYHPSNFKLNECIYNKTQNCPAVYCPYYHNQEERQYYNQLREQLLVNNPAANQEDELSVKKIEGNNEKKLLYFEWKSQFY